MGEELGDKPPLQGDGRRSLGIRAVELVFKFDNNTKEGVASEEGKRGSLDGFSIR
jgi:hypothetical protein